MKRYRVGIIGATGMVGQQLIRLLKNHPWFELTRLAASPRSAGQAYQQAIEGRWKLSTPCPAYVQNITVEDGVKDLPAIAQEVDLIFSALDMEKQAIKDLEEAYAAAGVAVVSTNSAHRWTDDVPMIIPEVNPDHASLIDQQRAGRGWTSGLIAVKPNCSIQSYVIALQALNQFRPQQIQVTSMQAVSGAGRTLKDWPEMADNLIPFIDGEEEKSEREPLKIWGKLSNKGIELAALPAIAATCIRVPVSDGHLADVSVKFAQKPIAEQIKQALISFEDPLADYNLPSSPKQLIHYTNEPDRPQPKLDRDLEKGMGVSVGRLRELPENNPYDWRFLSLSHNTVRGAAGGAILTAELLAAKNYLKNK